MAVTHWVKAKSGDKYTDRNGAEKEGMVTIGRMVETAKGAKMIILDCLPFSWLAAGTPVIMYLNAKDEKPNTAPASTQSSAPPPDEDLPF